MNDVRIAKGLQTQLRALEADAEALRIEVSTKQKELAHKKTMINDLLKQIAAIDNNGKLKVSEHALVRYFERVKGFDISEIENEILSDGVRPFSPSTWRFRPLS